MQAYGCSSCQQRRGAVLCETRRQAHLTRIQFRDGRLEGVDGLHIKHTFFDTIKSSKCLENELLEPSGFRERGEGLRPGSLGVKPSILTDMTRPAMSLPLNRRSRLYSNDHHPLQLALKPKDLSPKPWMPAALVSAAHWGACTLKELSSSRQTSLERRQLQPLPSATVDPTSKHTSPIQSLKSATAAAAAGV